MATQLIAKHILRKIFLEDWPLKLVALAITAGLWLAVTGLSTPTTTRFSGVPLTMQILNNTDITNAVTGEVDIVVSGDARRINRINKAALVASLDLTSMQPGERTVMLSPSNVFVDLPTGVKLDDISPNKLLIKLEAISEKDVPVRAETSGDTAANFEIYSRTTTPARVKVRGPESLVKSLDSIATEKIDVTGRSADFVARGVALAATNSKAAIQDSTVDVTFRIGEKRIERTFTVVANTGKRVRFTVFGPKSLLEKRKPEEFKAVVGSDSTPQILLPVDLADLVEVRSTKLL